MINYVKIIIGGGKKIDKNVFARRGCKEKNLRTRKKKMLETTYLKYGKKKKQSGKKQAKR